MIRAQGGGRIEPRTSPQPLLVAMVMSRPTDAVRQESPSTIMFADDIMRHDEIYNESREKNLERCPGKESKEGPLFFCFCFFLRVQRPSVQKFTLRKSCYLFAFSVIWLVLSAIAG